MAALGSLSDEVREEIRAEWKRRDYAAFGRSLGRPDLIETIDYNFDLLARSDPEQTVAAAIDAIVAASPAPDSGPERCDVAVGLVVYVYLRALHHWQLSVDRWPGELVVKLAERLDADRVVPGLLDYSRWLGHGYKTENGLNCSCPRQTESEAGCVAIATAPALTAFDGGDGWLGEVKTLLRHDAQVHADYFGTIAALAGALLDWVRHGPTAAAADVLAAGRDSLARLADDSHATNLRPQLAAFSALIESASQPRLCVKSARFTYVYPFVLIDVLGNDVGIDHLGVQIELSDVWTDEKERYPFRKELPHLTVRDELDYAAEIREGSNHTHYVRLTCEFELPADADEGGRAYLSLHILNQALRRATASMGTEKVHQKDDPGQEWNSVLEFVKEEVQKLEKRYGALPNPELANDVHVIVSTTDASVQLPDGSWRAAVPDDFATTVGASLLTREIRQRAATTLDEWLLQPSAPIRNLFEESGIRGELALGTANTTVLYMPTSPDWVVTDECEQMAEFVASQPSLFRKWERQLKQRDVQLGAFTTTLAEAVAPDGKRPDSDKLRDLEIELRKLETDIQLERARLRSLGVCQSQSSRSFIDALVAASPIPRLEQDLDGTLAGVTKRQQQIAAMTEALREREERHAALDLEGVLLLLAGIGAMSWFDGRFATWWGASGWRGVAIGLVIAAVIAFSWWFWRRRPAGRWHHRS